MGKVRPLLIAAADELGCPYVRIYEQALAEMGVHYERVFWDRKGQQTKRNATTHVFSRDHADGDLIHGAASYYQYGRYVRRLIKAGHYTHLICFQTLTAIALGRDAYSLPLTVDTRDLTYELNPAFRHLQGRLMAHAGLGVVSSRAFITHLPQRDYVLCHNLDNIEFDPKPICEAKTALYAGSLCYPKEILEVAKLLGKSDDWRLLLRGRDHGITSIEDELKTVLGNRYQRLGAYVPGDVPSMYENARAVVAVHGTKTLNNTAQMPNRFYLGLKYARPLIVSEGVYSGNLAVENGVGLYANEVSKSLSDRIEEFYAKTSYEEFKINCQKMLTNCYQDQLDFKRHLERFLGCSHSNCFETEGIPSHP